MANKKRKTIGYDAATRTWFDKFPIYERMYVETTVMRCETCGLFYKPELGHKCRKRREHTHGTE